MVPEDPKSPIEIKKNRTGWDRVENSTVSNESIELIHKYMDIYEYSYVTPTTNILEHIKIFKTIERNSKILKSRYPQFAEDFSKDFNIRVYKELVGKKPMSNEMDGVGPPTPLQSLGK